MIATTSVLLLISMIAPISMPSAEDIKRSQDMKEIQRESAEVNEIYARANGLAASDIDKASALDTYKNQITKISQKGLAFAKANPKTDEALEILWMVSQQWPDAERDLAYDMMADAYLEYQKMELIVGMAPSSARYSARVEAFLKAAEKSCPKPETRGQACLSLGLYNHELVRTIADLDHPIRGERTKKFVSQANIDRLRTTTSPVFKERANEYFRKTMREYSDLRPWGEESTPLGVQAEASMFRMNNLDAGCVVPDIVGEDLDGKPMKLSDFRGKITVVTFWATWCAPCMYQVPGENALVRKMAGRPFVMVGVNGDETREAAKKTAVKEDMPWRSFWEGGRLHGTPVKWGIEGWPTVYLIDAKGVIRDDGYIGHDLDVAVEALVKELESSRPQPK